jgi:putative DNA primase/helicase
VSAVDAVSVAQLQEVPQLLKEIPNWVQWKLVDDSKVPFVSGTQRHASSTDSSTWSSFDAVKNSTISSTAGIGFVIHGAASEQQIVGFDLDGSYDSETDTVAPWAVRIIDALASYTEYTPSNSGLRVWVKGALPAGDRVFNLDPASGFGPKVKIEVFDHARYFTVTGDSYFSGASTIETRDLTDVYKLLHEIRSQHPVAKSESTTSETSASVQIKQAGTVITTKLAILMNGTIKSQTPFVIEDERGASLEFPSQSEADLSLATCLALEHGDNAELIASEFAKSPLAAREKWNREDYRNGTISRAIKTAAKITTEAEAPKAVTATNATTGKRLNVQTGSNVTTRKIKWLWKHRVPLGKLTLFVGVPGSGKSLAAGDVAARLSTGKNWFDANNTFLPSDTLMLCGEDDIEDTTIPRLQAAGADLTKIHFLKSVITDEGKGETPEERELQFDKDLKQIEEFLHNSPDVRLIVVDPVSNYMGAAKMNAEQEVRSVLIPLKNLAEKMDVAIIGVMHLNKKVETNAINRVGGAMAFVGVARSAYLFQASEEEGNITQQHFMVLLKCNITKKVDGLVYEIPARTVMIEGSEEWMPYINFIATTTKNAEGVLQPKTEIPGRPPESLTVAKSWLKEFLSDGPKPSAEVFKAGKELKDLKPRTIERAKAEVGVVSAKDGKAWCWSLPAPETVVVLG